jgi:hypothetical protein
MPSSFESSLVIKFGASCSADLVAQFEREVGEYVSSVLEAGIGLGDDLSEEQLEPKAMLRSV